MTRQDPIEAAAKALRLTGWLVTIRRGNGVEVCVPSYEPQAPTWVTCPRCGEPRTAKGHDPCIADLQGVSDACCGHDQPERAYVATVNGRLFEGEGALKLWDDWLKTPEGRIVSGLPVELAELFWYVDVGPRGRRTLLSARAPRLICQLLQGECAGHRRLGQWGGNEQSGDAPPLPCGQM